MANIARTGDNKYNTAEIGNVEDDDEPKMAESGRVNIVKISTNN